MITMLEDLSTLPSKRLEKTLAKLADAALPCHAVRVLDWAPDHGITVALHVHAQGRGEVLDLARVVEDDPRAYGMADWSLLPNTHLHMWRLLLRVKVDRPVNCEFTISLDVSDQPLDPLRTSLPLLFAASRLAFALDEQTESGRPLVWITAPVAREPLLELLTAAGV